MLELCGKCSGSKSHWLRISFKVWRKCLWHQSAKVERSCFSVRALKAPFGLNVNPRITWNLSNWHWRSNTDIFRRESERQIPKQTQGEKNFQKIWIPPFEQVAGSNSFVRMRFFSVTGLSWEIHFFRKQLTQNFLVGCPASAVKGPASLIFSRETYVKLNSQAPPNVPTYFEGGLSDPRNHEVHTFSGVRVQGVSLTQGSHLKQTPGGFQFLGENKTFDQSSSCGTRTKRHKTPL